jgi:hypothetical protein
MEIVQTYDNGFVIENSRECNLLIQINLHSITFVIFDHRTKTFTGLKSSYFNSLSDSETKDTIGQIIQNEPFFDYEFSKVIFQFQSFRTMLVPESLFDSKNLSAFLKFHHDLDEKDHIHFIELKPSEAFVVFTVPVYIEDMLRNKFQNIMFTHHSFSFLYNALEFKVKDEISQSLHIHFANDFFDVLIIKNNKIQLFNSFFYKKYTDVIYFIANILNLFSLQPENTKVYISGQIEEESEVGIELKKIFKTIILEEYSTEFNYNTNLLSLPQHRYVNLINLNKCVSSAENIRVGI